MKKVEWSWDEFEKRLNSNTRWFMERVGESFAQYVPEGASVLEIGCGTGNILTYVAKEKNAQATGLDIAPEAESVVHAFAKKRGVEVTFTVGDGFDVPFPDNSFDIVLSEGVIEHFTDEETKKMVQEHVRVCKPGGAVLISVPNKWNIPLTLSKAVLGTKYPHHPEKSYSVRELSELISTCGATPTVLDGFAWQQGFAHWRIVKKAIYIFKYLIEHSRSGCERTVAMSA